MATSFDDLNEPLEQSLKNVVDTQSLRWVFVGGKGKLTADLNFRFIFNDDLTNYDSISRFKFSNSQSLFLSLFCFSKVVLVS